MTGNGNTTIVGDMEVYGDTALFLVDTDETALNCMYNCHTDTKLNPNPPKYFVVEKVHVTNTQTQALLDAIQKALPSCEYIEKVPIWKPIKYIDVETCNDVIFNNLRPGMIISKCGKNFEIKEVRMSNYCNC